MTGTPPGRRRIVVCDCLTLFLAVVGPSDGPASVLVAAFLAGDSTGLVGLTTTEEFDRGRRIVGDHAVRRPEKFPASAERLADRQFDRLATGVGSFEVLPHPQVVTIDAMARDDHLVLLSAAVVWGAQYFSSFNRDLRRMGQYGDVRIRTPRQILDEL